MYEPDSPSLPLKLAESLLHLKKGDEALARVEAFLKRQPHGVEGYELLAKVLKALGREAEITPRLEAAAAIDSKNVPLQYVLADRYREIGQVDRAEKMYETLLKSQPGPQGYGALANSLFRRKKIEELVKVINQAMKLRPGGIEAVQEPIKGIIEDSEMAEKVLAAGSKLYTADPPQLDRDGVQILFYIATLADKIDKFLPLQRLVLQRAPNEQAYKEMIDLLSSVKNYNEAASTFEEMLQKYPAERNAKMLTQLSLTYRQADKLEEAIATARQALKLDPNEGDALVQLAIALSQTGKIDESAEVLKNAAAKDPAIPNTR